MRRQVRVNTRGGQFHGNVGRLKYGWENVDKAVPDEEGTTGTASFALQLHVPAGGDTEREERCAVNRGVCPLLRFGSYGSEADG